MIDETKIFHFGTLSSTHEGVKEATRYAIDVAKSFNKFYTVHSVLNLEDEVLKATRLKLVEASAQVIKNALELIGIEVVEKM